MKSSSHWLLGVDVNLFQVIGSRMISIFVSVVLRRSIVSLLGESKAVELQTISLAGLITRTIVENVAVPGRCRNEKSSDFTITKRLHFVSVPRPTERQVIGLGFRRWMEAKKKVASRTVTDRVDKQKNFWFMSHRHTTSWVTSPTPVNHDKLLYESLIKLMKWMASGKHGLGPPLGVRLRINFEFFSHKKVRGNISSPHSSLNIYAHVGGN